MLEESTKRMVEELRDSYDRLAAREKLEGKISESYVARVRACAIMETLSLISRHELMLNVDRINELQGGK